MTMTTPDLFADADASARERALDVGRSFLVQAPAGSGKTELLIQRFLALLARVDRPERIVAMTFTRKAAGEMRERIIHALAAAAHADRPAPKSPHEARTRQLARAALEQDKRRDWQLAKHPARLAVQTIDAFCAGIARQAPLATRLGADPRFVDNAQPLYEAAVRAALAAARPDDPSWRRLLRHLDNDARRAVALLSSLLAKRAPLLRELVHPDSDALRTALEEVLADEIRGELRTIAAAFPPELAAALPPLELHAARHAAGAKRVAALAEALIACAEAGGTPGTTVEDSARWNALASWLLVAHDARFRAKVDVHDGFPPGGPLRDGVLRGERCVAMNALLAALASVPGLAAQLHLARRLPPARYGDDAWALVSALKDVLPVLAAELKIAFRDAGELDFVEGTIAAIDALGNDLAPSDLLLKLDARIDHLLIDEFQDTSYTQLALLRRLSAGWAEGDGRTVFAVGDPMQSIYRFREAEVRIFVEAQATGRVADIPVENLRLERNFRSDAALVEWVNRTFPHVLGARNDPWRGAVAFAPADAASARVCGVAVTLDVTETAAGEASRVVDRVRAALDQGTGSVAILVRARAHLDCVLPALRAAAIGYAAVELDALAERQAILDLESLTHALTQPADRLAWLSVLRAPWCGLALADIFALVAAADAHPSASIPALLDAPDSVAVMSADGSARLQRAASILRPALSARGRGSLTARVRGAWLALGGPATLDETIDLDAAERFFGLVAAHERAGDVPDWAAFVAALRELYAAPADEATARVQVMTLHRAKGLEFDTVILPGLGRRTAGRDAELLRLRIRERGPLVAPSRARGGDADPIYAYLGLLATDEDRAELGRLLYVGCTRAKSRLHLCTPLDVATGSNGQLAWAPAPRDSALARLGDTIVAMMPPLAPTRAPAVVPAPHAPRLVRVASHWRPAPPAAGIPVATEPSPGDDVPFDWAHETARCVGVVAHRWLTLVAREGLGAWSEARIAAIASRVRVELAETGVDPRELDRATEEVIGVLANVIADPRGRWLFAPGHEEARSEWALAGVDGGDVAHVAIDRSFVADGVRWIVDFKTGRHEGAEPEAFLDQERERYRDQLERYARFVQALDRRPICLGLYHAQLRGWREWPYAG